MAGKIRGITIELSADATGVLKAVEQVSSKIKATTTQMKDVDKLLKVDPTNFTLLNQKTQLLQKNISATKEKLNELKLAQADMDANGVDKNSEQYQALQREIIATEQELRKLEGTAGSASATLAKISAVTGKIGDKMETAGKTIMPVSVAMGSGLVAAAKSAIDFETAFAGVQKTVNGTDEQFATIKQGIIDMSEETASSAVEIAAVAEAAGQLGVATDDVLEFTRTMVMLGDTTNLSSTEAASSLAKFANITGTSASDYSRLGSVIVDLGNNFATTERDIVDMATNLASAGTLAGLTEPEIFALATAMSSVGIEAAAGGTAMTQTLTQIEKAVVEGGDNLYKIADIAGMTAEEFATAWNNDPITAIEGFISGLGDLDAQGESATLVLDELGMSGIRQSNMLKSLALAADTMSGAIDTASTAWTNNTALSDEAAKKYETTAAKIAQLKATLVEVGIQIGDILIPVIQKVVNWVKNLLKGFTSLDDGTKQTIVTIAGIVAALGPLLVVGGKVMKGISSITGALSKMGSSTAGPVGVAIAAAVALGVALKGVFDGWDAAYKASSPFTEALENIAKANDDLKVSIDNTKSSYESNVQASEANAAAAQGLYGHLENLIAGYDGTAAAQAAIEATVDELNQMLPGLGLAWDSVTNSLSLSKEEIYAQIEAMKAQAQAAALQEMYTDSLKEQYYAQKNVTDAAKTLQGVLDAHGLTLQEVYGIIGDGNITTQEAIQFCKDHNISLQDLQGVTEEVLGAINEYNDARANQNEADANVTFAEQELETAMVNAAEATAAAKDSIIESTAEINEQVDFDPAVQNAAEDGPAIGAELAAGMDSQSGTVASSAAGLAEDITNEFANTPAEMNAAGSDSGSNLNSGFGSWTGTVSGTVDEMYNFFYNTLGTLLPPLMSTWGSNSGQKYNSGLKLWSSDISSTAEKYATNLKNPLSQLSGMMRIIGSQAGQGLYNGLAAWQGTLSALANSIANSINAAARRALQIKSPSKVMMKVGEYTGEGLAVGLENSADGIYKTMSHIAGAIPDQIGSPAVGVSALNSRTNTVTSQQQATSSNVLQRSIDSVMQILSQYLPHIADDRDVYFDDGTWAGKLTPAINKEMQRMAMRTVRG